MSKFVVDAGNGKGLFGFFEDDGETGYFYLYEPNGNGIIDHLHIYSNPAKLKVRKKDVKVVWSSDFQKCGVKIWDKFYGVFDLASNLKISISIRDKETPSINKPSLLEGFYE